MLKTKASFFYSHTGSTSEITEMPLQNVHHYGNFLKQEYIVWVEKLYIAILIPQWISSVHPVNNGNHP